MRVSHWVSSALFGGSVLLLLWGLWILTFKTEPSAVGRTGVALIVISGASIGAALVGFIASLGLFVQARWARSAAWFASVLLVLTVVSSWAGVVAIVGLISSRMSPKT
jgi:hypothetical protein